MKVSKMNVLVGITVLLLWSFVTTTLCEEGIHTHYVSNNYTNDPNTLYFYIFVF